MTIEKAGLEFIEKLRSGPIGLQLERETEATRIAAKRAAIANYDTIAGVTAERIRKAQIALDAVLPRLANARKALAAIQAEVTELGNAVDDERRQADADLAEARRVIMANIGPTLHEACGRIRAAIAETERLPLASEEVREIVPDRSVDRIVVGKMLSTIPAIQSRRVWLNAGFNFIHDLAFSARDDGQEAMDRAVAFVLNSAPSGERKIVFWQRDVGEQHAHYAMRDAVGAAQAEAIRAFDAAAEKFLKSECSRAIAEAEHA